MSEPGHSAEIVDALGRRVVTWPPARRVVSLVPSETESVVALTDVSRLVGRTRYCEEPKGIIERVALVGGTKDIDVEAITQLSPDLVLANQEENSRPGVTALIAAGLRVYVSFPKTTAEGLLWVERLAQLLGVDPAHPEVRAAASLRASLPSIRRPRLLRAFVPIWRAPWMTFNGDTFAADLLACAGIENVFHDRERRTPLAADLGLRDEVRADRTADRDRRYPRLALEEAVAAQPDIVLLPDEPYAFGATDLAELSEAFPKAKVVACSGKDLFWYGTRIPRAIERLTTLIASVTR